MNILIIIGVIFLGAWLFVKVSSRIGEDQAIEAEEFRKKYDELIHKSIDSPSIRRGVGWSDAEKEKYIKNMWSRYSEMSQSNVSTNPNPIVESYKSPVRRYQATSTKRKKVKKV